MRSADAEPEAKADANPYLLYGGYGLGHLGYRGYYGYPYAHSYAYYGKRSADAEPKADADPYLLYGGYGYGHLGYRGYYGYPLPSLWWIWIWTPWIPWILWIPLWWICLLGISYNHQSFILLQKMDKTTIDVFFFSDNNFSA